MDKALKDVLITKLGTLMMANAELAADRAHLVAHARDQATQIDALRADAAKFRHAAGEGEEANGAALEAPNGAGVH